MEEGFLPPRAGPAGKDIVNICSITGPSVDTPIGQLILADVMSSNSHQPSIRRKQPRYGLKVLSLKMSALSLAHFPFRSTIIIISSLS